MARAFSTDLPEHVVLPMPALSPTMKKGNIVSWEVEVGEEVNPGDVLCSIETDKAVVDLEAQDEGFVAKILHGDGSTDVDVNTPIAVMVEEEDHVGAFENFVASAVAAAEPAKEPAQAVAPAPKTLAPKTAPAPARKAASGERIFASPLARKLAKEQGIDLALVSATGPNGRIIACDVEGYVPAPAPQAAAEATPASFDKSAVTVAWRTLKTWKCRPLDG